MHSRQRGALAPILLLCAGFLHALALAGGEPLERVVGRAECLEAVASQEPAVADPCNRPDARFLFRTEQGEELFFLAEDPRPRAFTDPRVRALRLELTGHRRDAATFEIVAIHSLHDGERYHVHYRCDVCDITTTAPGPCWCCGEDFELRQVPVDEGAG